MKNLTKEGAIDCFSEQISKVFSKYLSEEDYFYLKDKFTEEQLVMAKPKEVCFNEKHSGN